MTPNNKPSDNPEIAKVNAEIDLKKIEATSTAKEVASKYIGKTAIPWIVLLVAIGVGSSIFLKAEAMPAVIGLVSTAVMALITMLSGITGTKDKEEKPEYNIINGLIKNLQDSKEPMSVVVDGDKVTVTKGDNKISTSKK